VISSSEGTKIAVDGLFNLKTNDSALIEAILSEKRTSEQTAVIKSKLSQYPELVRIKLKLTIYTLSLFITFVRI